MKLRLVWLVLGSIAALAGALFLAKVSPGSSVQALFQGSLGSARAISGSLRESAPLIIAGLAVFLGLRAGLFNIGVEGQLLVGALSTAVIASKLPGYPGILLGVVGGMVAGALWAWPAGAIKAYRNGHEVITTIMLNSVAGLLTAFLAGGIFKDPKNPEPSTVMLDSTSRVNGLALSDGKLVLPVGIFIGIGLAIGLGLWLRRMVAGYELEAVGANPSAARFAGIDPKRVTVRAMMASGAISGLAGALQVLGSEGRFYVGFSPGYGFDALGVALLAGANPLAVLPSGALFGILAKGSTALQIEGVPKGITTVILGLLILIAAAVRYRKVQAVEA